MNPTAPVLLVLLSLAPISRAQWSSPVPLANVNSPAGEFGPALTIDGLTLYLTSDRAGGPGGSDLYRATRATRYGDFGAPVLVTELCSFAHDGDPTVRIDDQEILFLSSRPGGMGGFDLWRAERPLPSGAFAAAVPIAELNTPFADISPCLSADGLRVWFSSNRPGGLGGYDIWTASRPGWGMPFGPATNVVELNSPEDDRDPHETADGLALWFTSSRGGGPGTDDTWMASRLERATPFGNLVNVSALNSDGVDLSPAWALFTDEVLFASSRPGGPGSWDLFSARFTGLSALGIAGQASSQDLRFSDPGAPGNVYLAASALGTTPGIPIDTRLLPLNYDVVFRISLGGLAPLMTGYVGALDQDGTASGSISFPGLPQLVGLRLYTAFVVLDPAAPSGIRTISNAHELRVQ